MILQSETDWLLEQIVISINGTESKLPITITVDGLNISGNLISCHKYLEQIIGSITVPRIPPPEVEDEDLQNERLHALINQNIADVVDNQHSLREKAHFIHIEDAKFENGKSGSAGVLWRGVLEKISGFYLS